MGEDADFYQRFFYRNPVKYIEEPLAYYRQHQHQQRLSKDPREYLGISGRMYSNYKAMGVNNPFVLRKIARKLAVMEARNYAAANPGKPALFSALKLKLFPISCIKPYISGK